jgi:hypothetical protein
MDDRTTIRTEVCGRESGAPGRMGLGLFFYGAMSLPPSEAGEDATGAELIWFAKSFFFLSPLPPAGGELRRARSTRHYWCVKRTLLFFPSSGLNGRVRTLALYSLPQPYYPHFGLKCASTLAMALMSSSPQPWATPRRQRWRSICPRGTGAPRSKAVSTMNLASLVMCFRGKAAG